MCRHLAYLGAPIPLGALLTEPAHALVRQAQVARLQTYGTENPDGYGVGWWDADGELHRYRTATPIWEDARLPQLTSERSGAIVAAVRLASPGLPTEVSGNAPFTDGTWCCSLNGLVHDWHEGAGAELRAMLSPARADSLEGLTDTEVCFGLTLDRIDGGATPGEALYDVVHEVAARSTATLNFLLTDGKMLVATAWGNSLFTQVRDDSVLVVSEPLDDDATWAQVPDHTLVVVDGDRSVTSTSLDETAAQTGAR
jgi:glutamine amidotransferase